MYMLLSLDDYACDVPKTMGSLGGHLAYIGSSLCHCRFDVHALNWAPSSVEDWNV